ncbi:MAG: hypothetical protein QME74_05780 [Candidatus Edwardsbacteria bacterium]|nr:hypothetical protein [Candidatus Edwardsbacteria bacterium]
MINHDIDKNITGLLDRALQARSEPFEQTWGKSFSQSQLEANLELRLKLKTELLLAGLLTLASTIGIGLLLRFAELFSRQPAWQLVH